MSVVDKKGQQINLVFNKQMSSNCISQNCAQLCCNVYGYCPTSFGTSAQMNCYYYYYNLWAFWWIYFVIVVSSLLCCVIFICCIVACVRRKKRYQQDTIIINQQPMPYNNNAYQLNSTARNQVMMGQPVYLANQNQPLNYNQDNIYYARP